jgi:hypothetical protein
MMLKTDLSWTLAGGVALFAYLFWLTSASPLESLIGGALFVAIGIAIALQRRRRVLRRRSTYRDLG